MELGIIGLVLFGIVLTIAVAGVFRQPTSDAYFWLTVFTVWLLGNLPLNFAHTRVTWFLLAFAVASSALPTREPRELVPSEPVAPGTSHDRTDDKYTGQKSAFTHEVSSDGKF